MTIRKPRPYTWETAPESVKNYYRELAADQLFAEGKITMSMDDSTTDLYRDPTKITLIVYGSQSAFDELLASYGVKVQAQPVPTDHGVIKIMTTNDAIAAAAHYAANIPWAIIGDGHWDMAIRRIGDTSGGRLVSPGDGEPHGQTTGKRSRARPLLTKRPGP